MILDNQLAFLQTSNRRLDFLEVFTRHTKEIQILREVRISNTPLPNYFTTHNDLANHYP